MDELTHSQQVEENWIKTSVERVRDKYVRAKEKANFRWDLKTYWETDEMGLYCFETPSEMPTPYGPVLLTGDRNYTHEGRLVFHTRHVVALQFIPMQKLQHLFTCQDIFGDEGPLKLDLECEEIKPIQAFCKEMNVIIHKELLDLKNKRLRNIFQRMYDNLVVQDCEERLKKRFYYLKELMVKFRASPIVYRAELERMKLL